MELEFLRTEVGKMKNIAGVYNFDYNNFAQHEHDTGSEHESESSSEDEYIDDLPQKIESKQKKGPRTSVSAEVFGAWNKKGDFKAPSYPKTPQVKESLKKRLEQAFMFSCLNPEELAIVLDAMQNVKKQPGEVIIKEGDDGDNLYVVESGILTCTKIFVRLTSIKRYVEREHRTDIP